MISVKKLLHENCMRWRLEI